MLLDTVAPCKLSATGIPIAGIINNPKAMAVMNMPKPIFAGVEGSVPRLFKSEKAQITNGPSNMMKIGLKAWNNEGSIVLCLGCV